MPRLLLGEAVEAKGPEMFSVTLPLNSLKDCSQEHTGGRKTQAGRKTSERQVMDIRGYTASVSGQGLLPHGSCPDSASPQESGRPSLADRKRPTKDLS